MKLLKLEVDQTSLTFKFKIEYDTDKCHLLIHICFFFKWTLEKKAICDWYNGCNLSNFFNIKNLGSYAYVFCLEFVVEISNYVVNETRKFMMNRHVFFLSSFSKLSFIFFYRLLLTYSLSFFFRSLVLFFFSFIFILSFFCSFFYALGKIWATII
jgi:hypothetical protein